MYLSLTILSSSYCYFYSISEYKSHAKMPHFWYFAARKLRKLNMKATVNKLNNSIVQNPAFELSSFGYNIEALFFHLFQVNNYESKFKFVWN